MALALIACGGSVDDASDKPGSGDAGSGGSGGGGGRRSTPPPGAAGNAACISRCAGSGPSAGAPALAPDARCGDRVVSPGEACDDGVNDGSYGGCMAGCMERAAYCGDGEVDGDEVCDDGSNEGGADGCAPGCLSTTSGCGVPFTLWPAICREDLPEAMSDFVEPTVPAYNGIDVEARVFDDIKENAPGVRVTLVDGWKDYLFQSGTDVDYIIPEGASVEALVIDACTRCRVRGGGPNARIKYLNVRNSTDVTIDSVLIKADSAFDMLAVNVSDSTRLALISTIFHSPYSAAMFTSNLDGLLIAGSNWSSADANGVNDWGARFTKTSNVVIVDSQVEARGQQPVLRRGDGDLSHYFYLRTTTVNLHSPESVLDLGAGHEDHYDHMYQREPTYYISNLSARSNVLRYGASAGTDNFQGTYEITDARWHTPPSGDSAFMGDAELARQETAAWQYRLGSPVFDNTLTGTYEERHPGWPVRTSRLLGMPLSVANPYDL